MPIVRLICGFLLVGMFSTASWEERASTQNTSQESYVSSFLQTLFANQPDYMADMTIALVRNTVAQRFAKKQGKIRCEFSILDLKNGNLQRVGNDEMIVIVYPNRTWLGLDPREKTYSELPESFRPNLLNVKEFYKAVVRTEDEQRVILDKLGTVMLDGHNVQKTRLSFESNKPENGIFFYVRKDLKDLIVKIEVNDLYEDEPTRKGEKMFLSLTNVSLYVPDALFQIPKDYRKVNFNSLISTMKRRTSK